MTPLQELVKFYNPYIPESLKNLIYAMLRYEEVDRISIEDLLNELKKIIEELSSQFQKYKVPQHFRERRDISNNRTSFRSNRSLGN